jgi:preprotein translocase subunit SecG
MEARMKKLMIFATACALLIPQIVLACPMCKDSASSGGSGSDAASISGGINNSTYTLLFGLFFALSMVARNLIKAAKNTQLNWPQTTGQRNSQGFEVQPSDSSQDGIE